MIPKRRISEALTFDLLKQTKNRVRTKAGQDTVNDINASDARGLH